MTTPKTIDVTPTPAAYRNTLLFIVEYSTNQTDRVWAAEELVRIAPAVARGTWETPDA